MLIIRAEKICWFLEPNMSFLCCSKTPKNVIFMLSKTSINMLFYVAKLSFSKVGKYYFHILPHILLRKVDVVITRSFAEHNPSSLWCRKHFGLRLSKRKIVVILFWLSKNGIVLLSVWSSRIRCEIVVENFFLCFRQLISKFLQFRLHLFN